MHLYNLVTPLIRKSWRSRRPSYKGIFSSVLPRSHFFDLILATTRIQANDGLRLFGKSDEDLSAKIHMFWWSDYHCISGKWDKHISEKWELCQPATSLHESPSPFSHSLPWTCPLAGKGTLHYRVMTNTSRGGKREAVRYLLQARHEVKTSLAASGRRLLVPLAPLDPLVQFVLVFDLLKALAVSWNRWAASLSLQ